MARDGSFAHGDRDRLLSDGYPEKWARALPRSISDTYSGCGFAFSGSQLGETRVVVDLGCGAGLDCVYLSSHLPPGALIIGVDLAPEMLFLAQRALASMDFGRLNAIAGHMERLPLADSCADLVTANAAFNLAADKGAALSEAFRILRRGGLLCARDLVLDGPLPSEVLSDPMSFNTSLGGAGEESDLHQSLIQAGFQDIKISDHRPFSMVQSVQIRALKPNC